MQPSIIVVNLLYTLVAIVLYFVTYKVFDWITPNLDFAEELKKGNIAVAIVIGAMFVGISITIGAALN